MKKEVSGRKRKLKVGDSVTWMCPVAGGADPFYGGYAKAKGKIIAIHGDKFVVKERGEREEEVEEWQINIHGYGG